MATVTTLKRTNPSSLKHLNEFQMELEVDFAANNQGSGDIIQLFDVEANWYVKDLFHEVITAEGGTLTYDVGDDGSATRFVTGANGNAVAQTVANGDFLYTTNDTVDLRINNAADAAKIRVVASIVDYGKPT